MLLLLPVAAGFLIGTLIGCTALAVLLWVALAFQTRRMNRMRARAQQGGQQHGAGWQEVCLLSKSSRGLHPRLMGLMGRTVYCIQRS